MTPEERPNRIWPQVEVTMLFLQGAVRKGEQSLEDLRAKRGEAYAIEALESAIAEMSETLERLRADGLRLDRAANLAA